jgi:hypothetical protein
LSNQVPTPDIYGAHWVVAVNTELRTYRDYKGIGMCIVGKIEELRNDIGSLGCKVTPILDPPPLITFS